MKAIYLPDCDFNTLFIPHILKEIYLDKVFAKLKPCDVILDVGANIGLTAMYLQDFCHQLYAIEPSREHYEVLVKNIIMPPARKAGMHTYNLAISDKNCTCSLFLNDQNRTMNSLVWNTGKGETVRCVTFAQFMAENHIEEIDFCKLDVEGAEEAILLGEGFTSVCKSIKSMLVEFHVRDRVQFLRTHMFNLGYKSETVQANALLYWFSREV